MLVGPTLYIALSDSFSISAVRSARIAGRAAGTPDGLDLDNFTHHEAQVKISCEL